MFKDKHFGAIAENLFLARDPRGLHVVTRAGYILCTNSTRWRAGAVSHTAHMFPAAHNIVLHEGLAVTSWYCPASGTLLATDVHERGTRPQDDQVLDLERIESHFAGVNANTERRMEK